MQHLLETRNQFRNSKPIKLHAVAWAIGLTVFWPIINLIIFFARFGRMTWQLIAESITFAPLGLLSALVLFAFLNNAKSKGHVFSVGGGYILFMPIAFIAALASGLVLPPLVGPAIYGIIPLTIGMTAGFYFGKLFD
ncbi:MAG: hypothetical protein AB8G95_24855 [Anaerolineae bacterium]